MSDYVKEFFISNQEMEIIRSESKRVLESFELWSRRLINDEMSSIYGNDYFIYKLDDGNNLIKQEIINSIDLRMKSDPFRFPRRIDAILIEDIAYFLCKDDFYRDIYQDILEPYFSGQKEVRNRIKNLSEIRNKLNHGNPISVREAQRVICYSNDFIDCYKEHYKKSGKERDFNVPTFIKAEDSYGRCAYRNEISQKLELNNNFENGNIDNIRLRVGDVYEIWLEVDSSFSPDFYDVEWLIHDRIVGKGKHFKYIVKIEDVASPLFIHAQLRTHRKWHLSGSTDDWFTVYLDTILPPIDDTF